jgi:hypothetical protein
MEAKSMGALRTLHLIRRNGVYYFRFAIPRALARRIRLSELKGSLRITNGEIAKIAATRVSTSVMKLIAKTRAMASLPENELRTLLKSYFERCLLSALDTVECIRHDDKLDIEFEGKAYLEGADEVRNQLKAIAA